jgi:hypothetical protein
VASSSDEATATPSACQPVCLVITIFILPGSGLFTDANVFRPIITGMAQVVFLKNFRSFGKCQSNWLFLPMALLVLTATMSAIMLLKYIKNELVKLRNYTATGALMAG